MEHKDPPPEDDDGRSHSVLPAWVKFPSSADEFYPAEFDKVVYDCYNLRVVFDREKTGFDEQLMAKNLDYHTFEWYGGVDDERENFFVLGTGHRDHYKKGD